MKSLWSQHMDDQTSQFLWEEWPVVKVTAKRVFIPRHHYEAHRILRGEQKCATDTLYALDRAKLEREGQVFHSPGGGTGGECFYTDAGKAALETSRR